jgi:hypothetical protein
MGLWFRIRFGPFGYTIRGRRRSQNYRAYKATRDRRAKYAERYKRERASVDVAVAPYTPGRLKGRASPEYDGITAPTLRAWLRYWEGVAAGTRRVTPGSNNTVEMAPAEIAKLTAEIEARGFKVQPGDG